MSEVVAESVADSDALQKFLDAFLPIVNEAKLHMGDRGLWATAVDPGNVAMTTAALSPAGFEAFEAPGSATIGANLNAVDERIGVAGAGDLVTFGIDMETRKLQTKIRNIEQEIALIDPETIRKEPDDPLGPDELPNYVVLEGADLAESLEVADMITDCVAFRARPDDHEFEVFAEGDTDESRIVYSDADVIDADVSTECETLLSLDYSTDMVTPIPNDAEVTMHFGDEFPVIWEWEAVEGHLSVQQMISPRIRKD